MSDFLTIGLLEKHEKKQSPQNQINSCVALGFSLNVCGLIKSIQLDDKVNVEKPSYLPWRNITLNLFSQVKCDSKTTLKSVIKTLLKNITWVPWTSFSALIYSCFDYDTATKQKPYQNPYTCR